MSPERQPSSFRFSPAEQHSSGGARSAGRTLIAHYPELEPILERAVNATVHTFGINEETDAPLILDLAEAVAADLISAYAPIAAIATRTARTAGRSRAARLLEAARTAQVMADRVAEAAATLQARGDASAKTMALEASVAANRLAAAVAPGDEVAAATAAAHVATAVHQASAAKAHDRALAAAIVAQEAAAAAAQVADGADSQNVINELQVFEAATAVQTIALATCYQVAINAAATAAERALAVDLD
jgi:hypothetical protein